MLRRIAVLASLATVGAMFVGGSSAQAALGDNLTCVFTGVSGTLADDTNPANGIPGAAQDFGFDPANPGVPTDLGPDVETGTYNFSGSANCAGRIGPTTVTPNPSPTGSNATISSAGTYENDICGTGWANDPSGGGTSVDVTTIAGGPEVTNIGYEVRFTAGAGALNIGGKSTKPATAGNNLVGNYIGVGAVSILPQAGDSCVNGQVKQFDVRGGFAGVDNQAADN